MINMSFQYYFSSGMEIFLRIYISYYYHSLYSIITPSNIYPINYKIINSKKVTSSNINFQNIPNYTKYLNASKFKTFNIQL